MRSDASNTAVIIPALNEEESIGGLLDEIGAAVPGLTAVVIDDGSSDRTAVVARAHGARVLSLPCNLGVGGAVMAGLRYAFEEGYTYAVRCDGDGQHDPADIRRLMAAMEDPRIDLAIGSRFLADSFRTSSIVRHCGIAALSALLSLICRKRVTDPTSGFQMVNRRLMYMFSQSYPSDYPEPEALALLRRQGYDFVEVPANFRKRRAGRSTINAWGTLYYALKVFLALVVDRARPVDPRLARHTLESTL